MYLCACLHVSICVLGVCVSMSAYRISLCVCVCIIVCLCELMLHVFLCRLWGGVCVCVCDCAAGVHCVCVCMCPRAHVGASLGMALSEEGITFMPVAHLGHWYPCGSLKHHHAAILFLTVGRDLLRGEHHTIEGPYPPIRGTTTESI